MKTFYVVNKHNHHLLGSVRAASMKAAKRMAMSLFGCYTSVETP